MPLEFNKAKVQDYLRQVGSVDSVRNSTFEAGAQFQLNLDNQEVAKLEERIKELEANQKPGKKSK